MDQTGVVQTLSFSICLFIQNIGDTRNTIRRSMASYLKSCRPGKAANLGTTGSMLPRAGAGGWVLEEEVMSRRMREQSWGVRGHAPPRKVEI